MHDLSGSVRREVRREVCLSRIEETCCDGEERGRSSSDKSLRRVADMQPVSESLVRRRPLGVSRRCIEESAKIYGLLVTRGPDEVLRGGYPGKGM